MNESKTRIAMRMIARVCALLSACLGMAPWSFSAGNDTLTSRGDREVLRVVAKQAKVNRDSILTWTGEVSVVQSVVGQFGEKMLNSRLERAITFSYDRRAGKYSFLANQTQGAPMTWGAIRTPEGYFKVSPWKGEGGKENADEREKLKLATRPLLKIGSPTKEKRGAFSPDFDPFFYLEVDDFDIHDRLMFLHDNWNAKGMSSSVEVKRADNLVTVELVMPKTGYNRYTFDLDQGANVVKIEHNTSGIRVDMVRSYTKIAEVWVPASTHAKNVNSNAPTSTNESREIWQHQSLNGPIAADAFRPETIGLRKGDQVRDSRTKSEYTYDASGLPGDPKNRTRYWIAAILAAVVASAGLVVFGIRYVRERSARRDNRGQST